jgi:hypothetical protein
LSNFDHDLDWRETPFPAVECVVSK